MATTDSTWIENGQVLMRLRFRRKPGGHCYGELFAKIPGTDEVWELNFVVCDCKVPEGVRIDINPRGRVEDAVWHRFGTWLKPKNPGWTDGDQLVATSWKERIVYGERIIPDIELGRIDLNERTSREHTLIVLGKVEDAIGRYLWDNPKDFLDPSLETLFLEALYKKLHAYISEAVKTGALPNAH